jgi:hypothetical protein
MERMDMDHDGNVGGDEFLATLIDWGAVMQEAEWSRYVDHAFNRMDLDGDGYIDLDELLSELPEAYIEADRWVCLGGGGGGRLGEGGWEEVLWRRWGGKNLRVRDRWLCFGGQVAGDGRVLVEY